jgi:hypothetical protein
VLLPCKHQLPLLLLLLLLLYRLLPRTAYWNELV